MIKLGNWPMLNLRKRKPKNLNLSGSKFTLARFGRAMDKRQVNVKPIEGASRVFQGFTSMKLGFIYAFYRGI